MKTMGLMASLIRPDEFYMKFCLAGKDFHTTVAVADFSSTEDADASDQLAR